MITESLRKVQASLRFLDVERPVKVIVFSSSVAAEGKTSLSIQLARVLAEGSGDVLLIDGDLRRPQVATYLALEGGIGVADVLAGLGHSGPGRAAGAVTASPRAACR